MKYKKAVSIILILVLFLSISVNTFADDNANTGGGGSRGAKQGFYRSSEWMYKVSIYVGLSDKYDTNTPMSGYKLIGEPVYMRPDFPMPSNVGFTYYNKIQYLNDAPIELNTKYIEIVDPSVPRIPVTHDGNLDRVKNFFGDTNALNLAIDRIAQHYGTSREGLVSNITFNIGGVTGKFKPEDILPIKGDDGKYQNLVPWVIIYEPVTIAHFKDKQTRIAFTATEYAIAQKEGLFNFFYSGSDAQWIANMTHANLPNSLVLEHDWFGFKAYKPLGNNVKWSDDRIIAGGGWGMRILRAGEAREPDEEDEEIPGPPSGGSGISLRKIDIGDYRTDTDVVTSFRLGTRSPITPDAPAYVRFYVDGQLKATQEVVLPGEGSQMVWFKWHTPKDPKTVTVEARATQGFIQGDSVKNFKIADLDEYEPPDPRAKDPETGKVVVKPKWFEIVNPPSTPSVTSNEWSVWAAYWEENWVWVEDWVWVGSAENGRWEDYGEWEDQGKWIFYQNHYSASIAGYDMKFRPDEKVPTAKEKYGTWEMKSGYGYNIDTKLSVSTNAPSDVARQGNSIIYLPEFKYLGYLRLSQRMRDLEFRLKENKYSTFNQRVHFTPLWYPDDKYTTYTRIIDVWTPAGHLYVNLDEYMNIKGSVLDDYKPVPSKVDRK